jgi:hypothetical protein
VRTSSDDVVFDAKVSIFSIEILNLEVYIIVLFCL